MATVKRHWKLGVLFLSAAVLVTCLLLSHFWARLAIGQSSSPESPPAASQASPLDAKTYAAVQSLRDELCLVDRDLAAIGCSQDDAAKVLAALVEWRRANAATFTDIQAAKAKISKDLAQASSGTESQFRQRITDVQGQYSRLLADAQSRIEALLSDQQKATWRIARDNRFAPESYRYVPDLTPEQRKMLEQALRRRTMARLAARSPEEADAATKNFSDIESECLKANQLTSLRQSRTAMSEKMSGVLSAVEATIPPPTAVKPQG